MKYLAILSLALIVIYALYKSYQQAHIHNDLGKLISEGAVILDVRTVSEYEDGHIKPSVNIPLSKLRREYILLDTGKTYITCCSHGLRSVKAAEVLKEKGFRKVYNGGPWTDLERYLHSARP